MKRIILSSLLAICSVTASASQFDQLRQIELEAERVKAQERAEQLRQAEAARVRREANEAAYRRNKLAAEERARQQALELRKSQEAEEKRLRSREEQFEDEERALALEERRLKLQAMRARAARANDYIDAELRESAARTDVIQSEADSARNLTSGTKSLLEDSGKAEINRSKSLFGN